MTQFATIPLAHHAKTIRLAYEEHGKGPPILLVHGFPFNRSMWQEIAKGLAENHRVIVPDLRGFGDSDVIPGVATMEAMADDLKGLLTALGVSDRIVLGGLSMGGYVALAFARKYPQDLAGLILCDTRARADTDQAKKNRQRLAERVIREGTQFIADDMLPRLCCEQTFRIRPDLIEQIRTMILRASPEGVAAASLGMAERPDSMSLLGALPCPALILVGQFDVISPPEEMEEMARAIPHANFVVIPDAGHLAPLEQPTMVLNAVRDWLKGLK